MGSNSSTPIDDDDVPRYLRLQNRPDPEWEYHLCCGTVAALPPIKVVLSVHSVWQNHIQKNLTLRPCALRTPYIDTKSWPVEGGQLGTIFFLSSENIMAIVPTLRISNSYVCVVLRINVHGSVFSIINMLISLSLLLLSNSQSSTWSTRVIPARGYL